MKFQNNIYSQQTRRRLELQNTSNKERRTAELVRLVDEALKALGDNSPAWNNTTTSTIKV